MARIKKYVFTIGIGLFLSPFAITIASNVPTSSLLYRNEKDLLSPRVFSNNTQADIYFRMGEELRERLQFEEALEKFENVLSLNPSHRGVNLEIGRLYSIAPNVVSIDRAIDAFSREIEVSNDPYAYHMRGLMYGFLGKWQRAEADFRTETLLVQSWAAYVDLGWALLAQGKIDEAELAVQSALEIDGNFWGMSGAGVIALKQGEFSNALEFLERAVAEGNALTEQDYLSAYPGNDPRGARKGVLVMRAGAHFNLALAYERVGRYEEAVSHYNKYLHLLDQIMTYDVGPNPPVQRKEIEQRVLQLVSNSPAPLSGFSSVITSSQSRFWFPLGNGMEGSPFDAGLYLPACDPPPEEDEYPTVTATLRANRTSGTTQDTFPITFTARRTEGTATGAVTFSNAQCGAGGTSNPPVTIHTDGISASFSCRYTTLGDKTATITVTQEGVSTAPTATVTIRPILTVTVGGGTGTGTVTVSPGEMVCDWRCSFFMFNYGSSVTLTANPGVGVSPGAFTRWSGDGCSGTSTTCTVVMNRDREINARFDRPVLTINVIPPTGGTVTGGGAHNYRTTVTPVATPTPGYFFERWSNACTGSGACSVFMDRHRTLNAHFLSLISGITAPEWVRKNSPFNITVNTARTSTCTLTSTANDNRSAGPGTSFTFDNFRQSQPVIYTVSCRYGNTVDTRTVRINVLPTFGEF